MRPVALGSLANLLAASHSSVTDCRVAPAKPTAMDRPFLPEDFTQLYHTPFYRELTRSQRLRYNQLYGLRCNEQFMQFEEGFTQRVVSRLVRELQGRGEVLLAECLGLMLVEEGRHHALFRRFNRACLPEVYRSEAAYFTRLAPLEERLLGLVSARPRHCSLLMWLILVLEEFSTGFSRMLAAIDGPGELGELDAGYVRLHRLHLADESRHIQFDARVLEWLLSHSRPTVNRLNAWLFRRALGEVLAPKRSGVRVLQHLVKEFPELGCREQAMTRAVRALGADPGVKAIIDQPARMPVTYRLLASYPAFAWAA
jgi:hypothetical protein